MKRRSVHVFELRQYSDLSRHIKEPQNSIYCFNFFKKLRVLRPCFIPEVTCSVFSVSVLSVSSLLCDVFSLRENICVV